MINGFNYDFLTVTEKRVLDIINEFWIMSYRTTVEFDKRENVDKKISDYLHKFRNCLRLP